MPTLTIPLTTLQIGVRDFGPANIADSDRLVVLTIDRSVVNGLTATPAAHLDIQVMISRDGGTTWTPDAATGFHGGAITATAGGIRTEDVLSVNLTTETGKRIKATLTTSGSAVAVAGTLVTS